MEHLISFASIIRFQIERLKEEKATSILKIDALRANFEYMIKTTKADELVVIKHFLLSILYFEINIRKCCRRTWIY